jgi:hypothetical protein
MSSAQAVPATGSRAGRPVGGCGADEVCGGDSSAWGMTRVATTGQSYVATPVHQQRVVVHAGSGNFSGNGARRRLVDASRSLATQSLVSG